MKGRHVDQHFECGGAPGDGPPTLPDGSPRNPAIPLPSDIGIRSDAPRAAAPGLARRRRGHGQRQAGSRPRLRDRRWFRVCALLLALFLAWLAWSFGHAMTAPGGGSLAGRAAEWARDHYLGPLVTLGEWITYQPPKPAEPSFSLAVPRRQPGRPGPQASTPARRRLRPGRAGVAAVSRLPASRAGRRLLLWTSPIVALLEPTRSPRRTWPGVVSMNQLLGYKLSSPHRSSAGRCRRRGAGDRPKYQAGLAARSTAARRSPYQPLPDGTTALLRDAAARRGDHRLLPRRAAGHRPVGPRPADDPGGGRRPAEPAADRVERSHSALGEPERARRQRRPWAAATTSGGPASGSPPAAGSSWSTGRP